MYQEYDVSLFLFHFFLLFLFFFFSPTESPQHSFFGHPIFMLLNLVILLCLASIVFRIQNTFEPNSLAYNDVANDPQ